MSTVLERIDLRTSAETKALIARAAATAGMSMIRFIGVIPAPGTMLGKLD